MTISHRSRFNLSHPSSSSSSSPLPPTTARPGHFWCRGHQSSSSSVLYTVGLFLLVIVLCFHSFVAFQIRIHQSAVSESLSSPSSSAATTQKSMSSFHSYPFVALSRIQRPLTSRGRSFAGAVTSSGGVGGGGGTGMIRAGDGSSSTTTGTTPASMAFTGAGGLPQPPIPRRDEQAVTWVGAAPKDWDSSLLPRQAETSTEPLVDPPVPIPNPYGWMRDDDRTREEVLNHLHAENNYTTAVTAHLDGLRDTLYREMLSSIQETDYTTPRPDGDFYYYTRTFEGKSYTVHCRAPRNESRPKNSTENLHIDWDGTAETPILPGEQIVLDVNQIAEGKSYCSTGTVKTSPSHQLLGYAVDFKGDEVCQLYIRRLDNHEEYAIEDLQISGSFRWGQDDNTVFYMKLDAAKRPYQLYRRRLDTNQEELLFEEKDELFWMGIYKSMDDRYLFLQLESKETSEIHYLDLQDSSAVLQCIAQRRPKVLYEVEYRNRQWWIQSNVGGLPNMALFTSPAIPNSETFWRLVLDGDQQPIFEGGLDRSLDQITCFANHVVASGREGGLPRIWVMTVPSNTNNDTTGEQVIVSRLERLTFEEDAYDVGLGSHYEFDTDRLVVGYDSLVTPTQSIEILLDDTTQRVVLKEKAVPGYDRSLYACERTAVTSRDGVTKIPVSLVYRKDIMNHHMSSGDPVNVHLYGYGSYGSCVEADFRATRLTLLNRGIVYVLAHIRGGGEMGRQWYEEPNGAKYLCKKNTFNDFVDVARWLTDDRKLTAPEKLSCEGRSAGGLLIGASLNQAPEQFKAAILGVPFVDVITTMTDASIPLTIVEWEEWGNPSEVKYHQYMLEYSPMENVKSGAKYPSCLLTGGLHDPRVQFWEPAKFAATLRHAQSPESGPVCLKMDMSAGHFSASDRYKYLKELAFDYAFLLDQVGLAQQS